MKFKKRDEKKVEKKTEKRNATLYAFARTTLEKIAGGSLTQYKSAEAETKRRENELELKVLSERLTALIKKQTTSVVAPTVNGTTSPKKDDVAPMAHVVTSPKEEIVKEIEPPVDEIDYQATVKVIKAIVSIAISTLDSMERGNGNEIT